MSRQRYYIITQRYKLTPEDEIEELEEPAKEREVTGRENESNDAGEGSGSGTGLFPLANSWSANPRIAQLGLVTHAEEAVEQRVVV